METSLSPPPLASIGLATLLMGMTVLLDRLSDLPRVWALLRFEFMLRLRSFYMPFHVPRHPFLVWRLHPISRQEAEQAKDGTARGRLHLWDDEFRLVPDRLVFYDLGFGVMFCAISWLALDSVAWGVLSLIVLWVVLPIFLQMAVIRPEVYIGLDASVAPTLHQWFVNLPSHTVAYDSKEGAPGWWRLLFHTLPHYTRHLCRRWFSKNPPGLPSAGLKARLLTPYPRVDIYLFPSPKASFWVALRRTTHLAYHMLRNRLFLRPQNPGLLRVRRTDPVYTQALSSPQGAFLALAMASHFAASEESGTVVSRGFLRFFLTYCTPLWSAYLWLALTALTFGNMSPALTMMAFGWAAMSLWFVFSAVIRYGSWLDLVSSPFTSLRTLPYAPIWRSLPWPPPTLHVVRDRWVRLASVTITATGLALMLAAFQVLPADSDMASAAQKWWKTVLFSTDTPS